MPLGWPAIDYAPDNIGFNKTLRYRFCHFCLSAVTYSDSIAESNQFTAAADAEIRRINAAYKLKYDIDPR